jgi:hypothetical protein
MPHLQSARFRTRPSALRSRSVGASIARRFVAVMLGGTRDTFAIAHPAAELRKPSGELAKNVAIRLRALTGRRAPHR